MAPPTVKRDGKLPFADALRFSTHDLSLRRHERAQLTRVAFSVNDAGCKRSRLPLVGEAEVAFGEMVRSPRVQSERDQNALAAQFNFEKFNLAQNCGDRTFSVGQETETLNLGVRKLSVGQWPLGPSQRSDAVGCEVSSVAVANGSEREVCTFLQQAQQQQQQAAAAAATKQQPQAATKVSAKRKGKFPCDTERRTGRDCTHTNTHRG